MAAFLTLVYYLHPVLICRIVLSPLCAFSSRYTAPFHYLFISLWLIGIWWLTISSKKSIAPSYPVYDLQCTHTEHWRILFYISWNGKHRHSGQSSGRRLCCLPSVWQSITVTRWDLHISAELRGQHIHERGNCFTALIAGQFALSRQ